jgi:hypothetical protein
MSHLQFANDGNICLYWDRLLRVNPRQDVQIAASAGGYSRKVFDLPQCSSIFPRSASRMKSLAELNMSSIDIGFLALVIAGMSIFALTLGVVSVFAD